MLQESPELSDGPDIAAGHAIYRQRIAQAPVPNVFRVLDPRPDCFIAAVELFHALWWPGALSRAEKESIAVAVSAVNNCRY